MMPVRRIGGRGGEEVGGEGGGEMSGEGLREPG